MIILPTSAMIAKNSNQQNNNNINNADDDFDLDDLDIDLDDGNDDDFGLDDLDLKIGNVNGKDEASEENNKERDRRLKKETNRKQRDKTMSGKDGEESENLLCETCPAVLQDCQFVDATRKKEKDITDLNVQHQPLSTGLLISSAPVTMPGSVIPNWLWSPEAGQGFRSTQSLENKNNTNRPCTLRCAIHYQVININEQSADQKNKTKSSLDNITHPINSNNSINCLRYILERYNSLSWLTADQSSNGARRSCLPVHMCSLLRAYRNLELVTYLFNR